MPDKRWKQIEREHARDIGVERIPVSGRQRDLHGCDFEDALCQFQVKHGYGQPTYLSDWLNGICGTAEQHGKIGVVVWRNNRQKKGDAVVMLKWDDWVALHGHD